VEIDLVLEEAAMRGLVLGGGTVEAQPAAGLHVVADPDRLLQVVSNLVGNALRHGGPGVAVTLSARAAGPGHVAVEVADTGPGIAARDLAHVFDRFYRGAAARSGDQSPTPAPAAPGTDAPGGAGLGLAIVASLVEAMGGEVTVRSAPATGTTFTVLLPRAPAPDAPPPAPPREGSAGGEVRSGISGRRGG
jgi:signal transduction histidine kinase